KATLALAAIPLVVIGIYVPAPLQHLLAAAASAMGGRLTTMVTLAQEIVLRDHRSGFLGLCRERWGSRVAVSLEDRGPVCHIECRSADLQGTCEWLMGDLRFT